MNWYKKSQQQSELQQNELEDMTTVYRGDTSNDFALHEYNLNKSINENKELGGIFAEGPGIYFTTNKETASRYGEHVSEVNIPLTKFITPDSPPFSYEKIKSIVQSFSQETQEIASSNWDENFEAGLIKTINSIVGNDNAVDQLMTIWADVLSHQNPEEFVRIMTMHGIDGVVADQENEQHYIVYNKQLLK